KGFSIKQIPRGENKKADALSKIASTSFAHLSKQVLVEELREKAIDEKEILAVVEEEGHTWMTPVSEYLTEGVFPEEKKKARTACLETDNILAPISKLVPASLSLYYLHLHIYHIKIFFFWGFLSFSHMRKELESCLADRSMSSVEGGYTLSEDRLFGNVPSGMDQIKAPIKSFDIPWRVSSVGGEKQDGDGFIGFLTRYMVSYACDALDDHTGQSPPEVQPKDHIDRQLPHYHIRWVKPNR
nr:reverse transcriptase domain-containing protein [Tanacetum cinerariifolium]